MKTIKYFWLFFVLISSQLSAQEYNCITASIQEVAMQSKGRWLPSEGTINVLIVFAEFPDDNYDIYNTRWVKGSEPQNMSNWVDQTWSSSSTQGSLTHYFNDMSGNKLHFIGKEVHVTAPHTRDWYMTNYTSSRRGYIQKEIIQQLDATWDFAEFDNWDYISDYTYNNTSDTYVDMIIFVWRNISQDLIDPDQGLIDFNFTSNFADLGGIGNINVDNNQRKVATWFGGGNSTPYGSGVSVRNYLTEDPFRNTIHEFSHYLIGNNNYHNGFGFWGMLSAWGIRSYVANAYERYRLGWVADSTNYTISNTTQTLTGKTLGDFVTGRNAYRFINSASPQEYFFVENHQKTSYWENNAPFWGSHDGTLENGIYVIRKVGTPDQFNPSSWLQLIPADGRYDWAVNQSSTLPGEDDLLPVFKQGTPNRTSGYHDNMWIPFSYGGLTSPAPIHLTENPTTGQPLVDVRFHGDGKDAFGIGYNQVFSPWSNPNNQKAANSATPFGFEITSLSSGVYTLNLYVNTSIDASPSKPQNLHLTYADQYHPSLGWDINTETDITSYKIYRNYDNTGWDLAGTVTHPTNTFVDYAISYTKPIWEKSVKYYVVAVDNSSKTSVPSTQVETSGISELLPKINEENYAEEKTAEEVVHEFRLYDNYPDPFNPATTIKYQLPEAGMVTLKVYDILGREVVELVNENKSAGYYEVNFDASRLTSGVYIYTITAGKFTESKKMILAK
ncbi:MAG: T9SS type A sorting domain-containing protein [Ignavibacteriales bacterium]|nr:T9SS type A sorting domain-containing protein [Ignavibacteriales bacterium]